MPAWVPSLNRLARLTQAPKHHLADPALAVRLLGLGRAALLTGESGLVELPRDGSFLGAVFESLATMSVRVFAQAAEADVYHLRTQAGRRKIDVIVERDDGGIVALEVKLSPAIDDGDVTHLRWLRDQLGDRLLDAAVVSTGAQAYRRSDGIGVVPLALLGP
jgi:predicted AAA+ superfamily ATPase